LVEHEAREAARAVAALLDLASVGVEDAIAEVVSRRGRGLDQQHLVASHAQVAVGEAARIVGGDRKPLADAVQHHEVVALAVHLGESHRYILPRGTFRPPGCHTGERPRSSRASRTLRVPRPLTVFL
jgi:hypothetical protein